MSAGSVTAAMTRTGPPQRGQYLKSMSNTRRRRCIQVIGAAVGQGHPLVPIDGRCLATLSAGAGHNMIGFPAGDRARQERVEQIDDRVDISVSRISTLSNVVKPKPTHSRVVGCC
jgi:fumarylacetoacetate (FAA) hydrolase family protein